MAAHSALGYLANEPERLVCALHELRTTLSAPEGATGFGVAHYMDDRLLLNIRPSAVKGGTSLEELVGPLKTNAFLCGFHSPQDGGPFKFRAWSAMVIGGSQEPDLMARLGDRLPDFLQRNRSPTETLGEAAFHRFLATLHGAAKLDDPSLPARAIAVALRSTLAAAAGDLQVPTMMMVTNGRELVTAHAGSSLCYTLREGILACQRCDTDNKAQMDSFSLRESHRRFRGVMVGAGLTPLPPGFIVVPDGAVLTVNRRLQVETL